MPWNLLSIILVLIPQGKEKLCKKRFDEILSSFPATPLGLFVPKCLDDGGYRAIQCHNSTGYCWCVDDFGNELAGTRVRGQQNCSGESCVFFSKLTYFQRIINFFYSRSSYYYDSIIHHPITICTEKIWIISFVGSYFSQRCLIHENRVKGNSVSLWGWGKVTFTDLNFKLAYLRKILIALKALFELILADPMSS